MHFESNDLNAKYCVFCKFITSKRNIPKKVAPTTSNVI